jgi:hypothetical protein
MQWDDNWTRALVTVVAAAVGATLAGLANAYAAGRRIKEVELQYQYKLRDGYFENARKLTEQVYLPISIALTTLYKGYEHFVARSTSTDSVEANASLDEFSKVCKDYLDEIDGLFSRGADAYLISSLDVTLGDFTNFLRNSVGQKKVKRRVIVKANWGLWGLLAHQFPRTR